METRTFAHGNISTGKLAARYGRSIIGLVGEFYKQTPAGGSLEPKNVKRLVQVTGMYNDRGVTVYTFSDVTGPQGGFTRVADVKFAAYSDQEDALEVFQSRQAAYSELVHTRYVLTNDAAEKAAIHATARELITV